jgi:hypothetical protein
MLPYYSRRHSLFNNSGGWTKSTMGIRDFNLLRVQGRKRVNIGLNPIFYLPLFKSLTKSHSQVEKSWRNICCPLPPPTPRYVYDCSVLLYCYFLLYSDGDLLTMHLHRKSQHLFPPPPPERQNNSKKCH